MTLLEWLDRFPPRLCRIVATDYSGKRALTTRQIAGQSRLAVGTVAELSKRDSWAGCKVETIQAFALSCGVNHFKLAGKVKFLKRAKWTHMNRSRPGNHARSYFRRLMAV